MTRDDSISMAREAGIHVYPEFEAAFERFAALVAAAEREACASICEGIADTNKWSDATTAASAIRARSST